MPTEHILVKDLRPGMFIVESKLSWRLHPFLYNNQGLIIDQEEIDNIIKQGYQDTYYDPDLSINEATLENMNALKDNNVVPLKQEIIVQEKQYESCIANMKRIMLEARYGRVDIQSVMPFLRNITLSLNRNPDALMSLAKIKLYDEYTYVHSVNVCIYCLAFGKYLGMKGKELENLGLSGLFHDIGKIKIPISILNAPRKLNKKEFEIIKKHSKMGMDILSPCKEAMEEVLQGILDHHERYNGNGYPNKKKGKDISKFGKIIAICDVYDALSSRRSYHRAITPGAALTTMYKSCENDFDRELLEHFIKMTGIYPVGTPVLMSNGEVGIVIKSNTEKPLCPDVLICFDCGWRRTYQQKIVQPDPEQNLVILKAINPKNFPLNVLMTIRNMKIGLVNTV